MALDTIIDKSSPDLFQLVFPFVPQQERLSDINELVLNIHGTIIPGLTLNVEEGHWQGKKYPFATSDLQYDELTVDFIIDQEFKNWKVLYNWLIYFNNNKDRVTIEQSKYFVDASLIIYKPYEVPILTINFKNCWISNLGPVTLSTQDSEGIMEGNATFMYTRYEIE